MIVVHHLENSRSQRILWLLEELSMPYEVRRYARQKTMAAPPEMKQIHPLGKSPIVVDDNIVLAETGAIVEYLIEKAGGRLGAPSKREDALRYRFYLHYAEGSVMTNLLMSLVLGMMPIVGKIAQNRFQPMIATHLDYIESELTRPWFAGENLTGADVMMSFPLEFAAARLNGLEGRPNTAAWLQRVHGRPAYQAGLRTGGPYALAT